MKNNSGILISNFPQSWGLDVENGDKGKEVSRTEEGDEGQKSIFHLIPQIFSECLPCADTGIFNMSRFSFDLGGR